MGKTMQKGIKVRILIMININDVVQEDLNALKKSDYEAFRSLAQVMLDRILDEIKSEEKNIIQSQNKISNLEKRINNLSEKEQNLPKNQSQQVAENDLREFIPENNLNSSITNPKYAMWYKNNINIICEHRGRKMGLPKDYPLIQRDCCYGLEIGSY